MSNNILSKKIIHLKNTDLKLRDKLIKRGQLNEGYNVEMAQLHNKNAEILNEIIDDIGYPISEKVGKEASEAAWLIIQHSIGKPEFMRKCKKLLEQAVAKNQANPINLAYLTDRIAVFEGKPQSYGTSFDWNEKGELCPNIFDDLDLVNRRRKSLGLNSIEDRTEIMRRQAKNEMLSPPTDYQKKKSQFNKWRKAVGWIK